ncbi:MAG: hypothetical protein A2Y33_05880 [Spirochaetes bacterium GWF1_51_8]|nr:MAG: hypothetical protein A2Y33_05880 [Spirochaetes bacterium GWF1_51_8]
MRNDIIIRPAAAGDIDGIIPVWKEFAELHGGLDPRERKKPKAEQAFRQTLAEKIGGDKSGVLAALVDNEITGFALLSVRKDDPVFPDPDFGFVEILAVSDKWRRHGIGELLYLEAEKWFRSQGLTHIELFIVPANILASSFWKKMGYSPYLELLYKKI